MAYEDLFSTKARTEISVFGKAAVYFDESVSYSVGDVVDKDAEIYRCIVSHPAGKWDPEHFLRLVISTGDNAVNVIKATVEGTEKTVLPVDGVADITPLVGAGGEGPKEYVKDANVSEDKSKLSLTKNDGSVVEFDTIVMDEKVRAVLDSGITAEKVKSILSRYDVAACVSAGDVLEQLLKGYVGSSLEELVDKLNEDVELAIREGVIPDWWRRHLTTDDIVSVESASASGKAADALSVKGAIAEVNEKVETVKTAVDGKRSLNDLAVYENRESDNWHGIAAWCVEIDGVAHRVPRDLSLANRYMWAADGISIEEDAVTKTAYRLYIAMMPGPAVFPMFDLDSRRAVTIGGKTVYVSAPEKFSDTLATKSDLAGIGGDIQAHTTNKLNPHAVTAQQVGAYTTGEIDVTVTRLEGGIAEAKSDAEAAKSTAETANTTATEAKVAAEAAQSTADEAQTTANEANSAAEEAQGTANEALAGLEGKLDNEDETCVLSLNEGLSVKFKPIEGVPIPGGGIGVGRPEMQTSYGVDFVIFDGGKNGSASFRRTGSNEVFAYLSDLDSALESKLDKSEPEGVGRLQINSRNEEAKDDNVQLSPSEIYFSAGGKTNNLRFPDHDSTDNTLRPEGTEDVDILATRDWTDKHYALVTDTRLQVDGKAADAKAVGEAMAGKRGLTDMKVYTVRLMPQYKISIDPSDTEGLDLSEMTFELRSDDIILHDKNSIDIAVFDIEGRMTYKRAAVQINGDVRFNWPTSFPMLFIGGELATTDDIVPAANPISFGYNLVINSFGDQFNSDFGFVDFPTDETPWAGYTVKVFKNTATGYVVKKETILDYLFHMTGTRYLPVYGTGSSEFVFTTKDSVVWKLQYDDASAKLYAFRVDDFPLAKKEDVEEAVGRKADAAKSDVYGVNFDASAYGDKVKVHLYAVGESALSAVDLSKSSIEGGYSATLVRGEDSLGAYVKASWKKTETALLGNSVRFYDDGSTVNSFIGQTVRGSYSWVSEGQVFDTSKAADAAKLGGVAPDLYAKLSDVADKTKLTPVYSGWTLGNHYDEFLFRNISATYNEDEKGWDTSEEMSQDGGVTWQTATVSASYNPDPDRSATSVICVSATFNRTIIGYTTENGENLAAGGDGLSASVKALSIEDFPDALSGDSNAKLVETIDSRIEAAIGIVSKDLQAAIDGVTDDEVEDGEEEEF